MAENPFAKYRTAQPGGNVFVPAPGAGEEQAREGRQEARQEAGEARAGRAEARDIARGDREVIGEYRKEFLANPEVKDFRNVANATRQILTLAEREGTAMGDMGLVFAYMKSLDPGSVVREGEQASAQNAAGVPDRIRNLYNNLASGERLTPEQRADMASTALDIYGSRAQSYDTFANTYRGLITDAGGDPEKQGVTLAPQLKPEQVTVGGGAPAGKVDIKRPGQPFLTKEDKDIRNSIQAAWDSGASVEEIAALAAGAGRRFTPAEMNQMRELRQKNLPAQFSVTPTGTPTAAEGLLGDILSTPAGEAFGGYSIGTLNALTGGFAVPEEIKEYARETAPVSSFFGELTGGAVAAIPAIRGAQGVLAGTRLAGAAPLIGETAYGALYGAGEAGEGNRLRGAAIGGVSGLAGGALVNRFLPGGPGTFTGAPRPPAPTTGRFGGGQATPEDIIAAGQQANIPVMTSDVMPPVTRLEQLGQTLAEVAPLGTAAPRRQQQVARQEAVETLLSDFGVTVDADIATDVVRNLNETRSNMLSRFTGQKESVIGKFAGAGDVPTTKSVSAIDNLLVDLRRENLPQLNSLINQLEGVRTSLTGPGDLPKIEANRKTLFTLKGDPNLASISDKSEKAFTAVYNALNDDMGEFIKTAGGSRDFALWKTANTRLAEMAGELKVGGLKGALNRGEFDPSIVTKMLTSSKPEEARMLFRNLNKEGRENARLLLIQEAGKRALNTDTNIINPDKFAREIGKLSGNFGQFFGASDMRRVQGLADVLRATRRAQEAQFLPRTGEQVVPFAAPAALGALIPGLGVLEGAAIGAAFGAARRFYESKPARDLLLRISQASGSKKMELINQFVAGAATTGGAMGGAALAGPTSQQ
jgi:hypothetical protein